MAREAAAATDTQVKENTVQAKEHDKDSGKGKLTAHAFMVILVQS